MVSKTEDKRFACKYATWREDQEAQEGHSRELISVYTDPKQVADMNNCKTNHDGCETTLDFFDKQVKQRPDVDFLGTRQQLGNDAKGKPQFGNYTWKTYKQVQETAQAVGKGISVLNLATPQDDDGRHFQFIGIWAKNRREWLETHIANMYFDRTTIGFFDSMGPQSVDYILNQTQLSTIFCTSEYIEKILKMKKDGQAATVCTLVCFDAFKEDQKATAESNGLQVMSFESVEKAGKDSKEEITNRCKLESFPIFSYTSGTTGDSKGVMLSHKNLVAGALAIIPRIKFQQSDIMVSYLPYPHSFEQIMTVTACIFGYKIGYYSGDPLRLTEDCGILKPTLFPSVPRLYNRIYGVFNQKIREAGCLGKCLVTKAVNAKLSKWRSGQTCYKSGWDFAFKKFRAALGGNVRYMITGSAPIDKQVLEFFKVCFSCPLIEGYGLTETSGGSSITWENDASGGHVGGPLSCVKWRLKDVPEMQYFASDKPYPRGELCMYGPSVFCGYYKRPEKTAECFDEQGWFRTGDVCEVYPNGAVRIIDRSKNIFKLSQGEYIAPEKVEGIFAICPYVAQSMLYGDSLKNCCVLIVVPDPDKAAAYVKEKGITMDQVWTDPGFKELLMTELDKIGKANNLSSLERPKDIFVCKEAFSVENDILTATFKLKRNIGREVFKEQIDNMYKALAAKGM